MVGVVASRYGDLSSATRAAGVEAHASARTLNSRITQFLLDRAEAIVVIPSLIKGGFVIGVEHGKGVMSRRDRATNSWSAPAFVNMTGGSIGWQIGAQTVDLVLLVMNGRGVTQLLEDRFTVGGSMSVAAGPVGRAADVATIAQLNAQILAYSRAQGLFAGAVLERSALHAAENDNEDFYGRQYCLETIVNGRLPTELPPMAQAWKQNLTDRTSSAAGALGRAGDRAAQSGAAATDAAERSRDAIHDAAGQAGDAVEDAAAKAGNAVEEPGDTVK